MSLEEEQAIVLKHKPSHPEMHSETPPEAAKPPTVDDVPHILSLDEENDAAGPPEIMSLEEEQAIVLKLKRSHPETFPETPPKATTPPMVAVDTPRIFTFEEEMAATLAFKTNSMPSSRLSSELAIESPFSEPSRQHKSQKSLKETEPARVIQPCSTTPLSDELPLQSESQWSPNGCIPFTDNATDLTGLTIPCPQGKSIQGIEKQLVTLQVTPTPMLMLSQTKHQNHDESSYMALYEKSKSYKRNVQITESTDDKPRVRKHTKDDILVVLQPTPPMNTIYGKEKSSVSPKSPEMPNQRSHQNRQSKDDISVMTQPIPPHVTVSGREKNPKPPKKVLNQSPHLYRKCNDTRLVMQQPTPPLGTTSVKEKSPKSPKKALYQSQARLYKKCKDTQLVTPQPPNFLNALCAEEKDTVEFHHETEQLVWLVEEEERSKTLQEPLRSKGSASRDGGEGTQTFIDRTHSTQWVPPNEQPPSQMENKRDANLVLEKMEVR